MEKTIIDSPPGMLKPSLNYGLLISVALIILGLVFYLLGAYTSSIRSWLEIAVILGGLIYAALMFRNEVNGGYISYGRSLGFLTLSGLFTGIFTGIFQFILLAFIAPDLMELIRTETIIATEQLHITLNPNISSEELDRYVDWGLKFQTPFWNLVQSIFGWTFWGFLGGLIISIFIKRNPKPLEEV